MLKVNEIFASIQGESTYMGLPCVFIRLTGCNLRCKYCDTVYAYEEGREISLPQIVAQTLSYKIPLIEITGGEPLCQDKTPDLARILIEQNKTVLVETNGSMPIETLPDGVIRIMDIKCPSSGMSDQMDWENIKQLKAKDEVKFVIADRNDFDWAHEVVQKHGLTQKAAVLFSPVHQVQKPEELADWILHVKLNVRLQLQLHQILWPGEKGK